MNLNSLFFFDIVYYKGELYIKDEDLNSCPLSFMHDPLSFDPHIKPLSSAPTTFNLDTLPKLHTPVVSSQPHENILHHLWDGLYPSWLTFYLCFPHLAFDDYIPVFKQYVAHGVTKNHQITKKFTGHQTIPLHFLSDPNFGPGCVLDLLDSPQDPFVIKYFVSSRIPDARLGTYCDLHYSRMGRGYTPESYRDPVDEFVNRMYLRYNIPRNQNAFDLKDVLILENKRPYEGIKALISKVAHQYKDFNFKYVNFNDFLCLSNHGDLKVKDYKFTYINDFAYIDDFESQLKLFNNARLVISGPSTSRARTPFLPHGGIEIQMHSHGSRDNTIVMHDNNSISCVSKYLKVLNVKSYSQKEIETKSVSSEVESLINEALNLNEIPLPLRALDNLHPIINNLNKEGIVVDNLKTNSTRSYEYK
jgi:hypothetical protein